MSLLNLDPFLEELLLINSKFKIKYSVYWDSLIKTENYELKKTQNWLNRTREHLRFTLEELKKEDFLSLTGSWNNKLISIPNFKLPNLKILLLNCNKLTWIHNFRLPNLKILSVHGNKLVSVPNFKLPNLEELDLGFNRLTFVPNFKSEFLPKLKKLSLTMNRLISVPNFNLPELKRLGLSHNCITVVPNFNLPKLKELFLIYNCLSEEEKNKIKNKYEFAVLNHVLKIKE